MKKLLLPLLLFFIVTGNNILLAQVPQGTSFLNNESLLTDKKDKQWYLENIPFLEVPDQQIQEVYYYRWFSYYTNLRYTYPSTGYVVTEFSSDVWWQSPYGTIPCAGSMQIYEGRWLKNQRFMNDVQTYWANGVGTPHSHNYSFWEATAGYLRYQVNGNAEFIKNLYEPLIVSYYRWQNKYNKDLGLYWQEGVWDGMELSATSYQADNEAPGYRPTINSYLYGEATALSRIADMVGDESGKTQFAADAAAIQNKFHEHLWDESATFFKHKFRDEVLGTGAYPKNKYYAKESFVDAREVYSYTSWYTNLAKDEAKYSEAWKFLFDGENGFYAPYGPTTLERSHRLFLYDAANCCRWNGMSWPFSSSQTLTAMANVLNDYENKGMINKERYFDMLSIYTRTQYKNGKPYVAEAHHPDNDTWNYDILYRSQHYNHSTYNDLIISGLIGIRPSADNTLTVNPQVPDTWEYFILENVPYHGHLITILYDKTGLKYGVEAGFHIYENNHLIHSQPEIGKVTVPISEPNLSHNYGIVYKENYASNPDRTGYPQANASHFISIQPENVQAPYENYWQAVDGKIRFEDRPTSRWTTEGSSNASDWFEVDYGIEKTINRVDVCFYGDDNLVKAPTSYRLLYWNGEDWQDIPDQQRASATPIIERNVITFPSLNTEKVRIEVVPQSGFSFGITEFETLYELIDGMMIKTDNIANAMLNLPYKEPIAFLGGTAPYTFEITENALPQGLQINNEGVISGTATTLGTYSFVVTVTDSESKTHSKTLSIQVVNSTASRNLPIPGTIEFEYYDKGGEGVAYHDSDAANHGNVYRTTEGVDIFNIGATGRGLGWTASGEWLHYTVNIAEAGEYDATVYYTTPSAMVIAELWVDNVPLEEAFYLPHTGTYGTAVENYRTVTIRVNLPQGEHKLRFYLKLCSNADFDKMVFAKAGTSGTNDNMLSEKITVSPNPSKNDFNVISELPVEGIIIFDMSGKIIEKLSSAEAFGSAYSPGSYLVQIQTQSGDIVKKIMKK